MTTASRFFCPPSGSYFLLGPRGTGKTSLATALYDRALRVDLLDRATFRLLASRPERIRELVDGQPDLQHVVIDEVQKLPELLEMVHLLIEEKRGLQFILTGSSARKLRRGGVNLLGGRAALRSLHPFMAAELPEPFDLAAALRLGMLPLVRASADPEGTLGGYSALYMQEEVQMEGFVRNIGSFARCLEALSFSQAAVLNMSNVARECEVSRTTVEGYLAILEDLLLAFRLPVFSRRARRDLAAHPKFFLFDAGVFRANRPAGPLDFGPEIEGVALETLVAQHLRAWCDYTSGDHRLYYWQTRSRLEVDFVVYGNRDFHALEVKNATRVRPEDLRGLKAFKEDYPECRAWLLHRGAQRSLIEGIHCVPVTEFLCGLRPGSIGG